MTGSLIDRITNFFAPFDEVEGHTNAAVDKSGVSKIAHLRVHSGNSTDMKVMVVSPEVYDDVRFYADYLKGNNTIIINFDKINDSIMHSMCDFLDGVVYFLGGSCQRISNRIVMYTPGNVEIKKELYAYSIPTYVKY